MKAFLERWLARRWYGGVDPGLGLRALAGVYRALAARKATTAVRLAVPVLVVGNFTVGGTGKTPLVIALALYFQERGFRPGIISRGHGRRSREPLRVNADTPASACGDEPRLMFERTGLPVMVDEDRVRAGITAIAAGCNLLIADDGLQHLRLARDIEIEVCDGERGYGNGLLLPAGPLRERPRRCDFKVVNSNSKRDDGWSMQMQLMDAVEITSAPPGPLAVAGQAARRPLAGFAPGPVHAVAGIGNPERFFSALQGAGLKVDAHPFADHHDFVLADFAGMDGPVLMTEKDAVKCRDLGLKDAWAVPVDATLTPGFFHAVESALDGIHART